jgi:hypothetical protein
LIAARPCAVKRSDIAGMMAGGCLRTVFIRSNLSRKQSKFHQPMLFFALKVYVNAH